MIRPVARWLNSIYAHVVVVALGVLIGTAVVSYASLYLFIPPPRMPVSLLDLVRAVRLEALAPGVGPIEESVGRTVPSHAGLAEEARLSRALADRLRLPRGDVRVYLSTGDIERLDVVAQNRELYRQYEASDPLVLGSFTIAIRRADGNWRVLHRTSRNPNGAWGMVSARGLFAGLLITLLLSLWLSARLARPIRSFASAAELLSAGHGERLTVTGPNEIRVAAQSFNDMHDRIRRFIDERTLMLGAIAHDLRSPLMRLQFMVASLPPGSRGPLLGEIAEMDRLLRKTMDFIEHQTRLYDKELVDLSTIVETVIDDYSDMKRDVQAVELQRVVVLGDSAMLKRVFINLIDNALTYGGEARVAVRQTDDWACVQVSDRGCGIPEDQIAKVFEPFFRIDKSRGAKTGGGGLGLAIVKSAVEAHGGTVALENGSQGGCVAEVRLPAQKAALTT